MSEFLNSYITQHQLVVIAAKHDDLVCKQTINIMQGIKEIAGLIFWMDNKKSKYLKAAMSKERIIPKEKQLINNQLNQDKLDGNSLNLHQDNSL